MKYFQLFEENMHKGGDYLVMYENSKLYDILLEDFRAMDISSKTVRRNGGLRLQLNSTYTQYPIQIYFHGQIRYQVAKNPISYSFQSPVRSYKDAATPEQVDELLTHFYYCLLKKVYETMKYRHEDKIKNIVKQHKLRISDGPEALYTMFLELYKEYPRDIEPICFPKSVWNGDPKVFRLLFKMFKKYIPSKVKKTSDDYVDLTTFPEYKQIFDEFGITKDITTKTHKNAGGFKWQVENEFMKVQIYANIAKQRILYKMTGSASSYNFGDNNLREARLETKVVDDASAKQFFEEFSKILNYKIAPTVNHTILNYLVEDYEISSWKVDQYIEDNGLENYYANNYGFTMIDNLLLISNKKFSDSMIKTYRNLNKFDVL